MKVPDIKEVFEELNSHSPSLCLAKWKQVTIMLQNGTTHSCHHPIPHKIPLEEIEVNPGALHNTKFKKIQRKAMLEGKRPAECDYCWRVEDGSGENISDRAYKSAHPSAYPYLSEIISLPWDSEVDPTYLEVSFGNECQFKCAYCSPMVSSGIMAEYQKHGAYKVQPYFNLDLLKKLKQYPYAKDEANPYVDAFWKWFPKISGKLHDFRITGGEPLLNQNTYRILESIIDEPRPDLQLSINSNLGVPQQYLTKFIQLSSKIMQGKVKEFHLFTSLDTFGEQAEYIRYGLNYDTFIANVRQILDALPDLGLTFMCTFNALSVPGFEKFLEVIRDLKLAYPQNEHHSRINVSIPYLRHPPFMSAIILSDDFIPYVERSLDFMLRNSQVGKFWTFNEQEVGDLRRILEWMKNPDVTELEKQQLRKHFYFFFKEYDDRKGTNFLKTFPEMKTFWGDIILSTISEGA
jgi:organic radical activating enzyme